MQVAVPIAGLFASEDQVSVIEKVVKVTEIEPEAEKKLEEEAPASSPADDVPTTEETVDESLITEEDFAEKLTVTSPASEPKAESAHKLLHRFNAFVKKQHEASLYFGNNW